MSNAISGCYKNDSYTKAEYECPFCKMKWCTYKHAFTQHLNKCKFNPNSPNCEKEFTVCCEKCGVEYTIKCTSGNYNNGYYRHCCSSECAHKRKLSDESKKKISDSLYKTLGTTPKVQPTCIKCGKPITYTNSRGWCQECVRSNNKEYRELFPLSDDAKKKLSLAGRKSAEIQSETRRSKGEIEFCNLCEQYFSHVEHNNSIFNGWDADIIVHDVKYAILWNGPWHYKKITKNHSVEQVQNRDRIKINEIIKCGYTPYIIIVPSKCKQSFITNEFEKFLNVLSNNSSS